MKRCRRPNRFGSVRRWGGMIPARAGAGKNSRIAVAGESMDFRLPIADCRLEDGGIFGWGACCGWGHPRSARWVALVAVLAPGFVSSNEGLYIPTDGVPPILERELRRVWVAPVSNVVSACETTRP